MKKLFIFALMAVMFTGCGVSEVTSSESVAEVTSITEVAATEDSTSIETTAETTTDITNIDLNITVKSKTNTPAQTAAATTKAKETATTAPAATTAKQPLSTSPSVKKYYAPATTAAPIITTAPAPVTTAVTTAPKTTNSNSTFQQQVVNLVNAERAKAGLSPLSILSSAEKAAQVRASEIITSFSHTRPNGSTPFTALDEQGIKYTAAGENIAAGQATPQEVMNSWMNSSGHRANILNPNFTHIGVGYAQGGSYGTNWVQLFVKL